MSSRLPYCTPSFAEAISDPVKMEAWEQEQLKTFQSQLEASPSDFDALLGCAELAIRQQNASLADHYLLHALKLKPLDPDVHYLKVTLLIAQDLRDEAGRHLEKIGKKIQGLSSVDAARLQRLYAEYCLNYTDNLQGANQAMIQAIKQIGSPRFFHAASPERASMTQRDLEFDQQVFDHLYSWEGYPAEVRFSAIATDQSNQVYILENTHKWLFHFDAEGNLLKGLTENHLSGRDFLFPEHFWHFMDITTDKEDTIYVASRQGAVQAFNRQWEPGITFTHPEGSRVGKIISIAVDSRQVLYVLYLHRTGVHAFDREGNYIDSFGNNTTMPDTPNNYYCGLAVDSHDKLYLYDRCCVQIFNTETWECTNVLEVPDSDPDDMLQENYPFCWNGIDVDSNGTLYLANTYEENVVVLDKDGNPFEMIDRTNQQLQVFCHPTDVAIDGQGSLYVVDTGHARVLKRTGTSHWSLFLGDPNWKCS